VRSVQRLHDLEIDNHDRKTSCDVNPLLDQNKCVNNVQRDAHVTRCGRKRLDL
jgi:hypothetical protein